MGLSDLQFLELDAEIDLSNFDCGDDDITNWLKEDALNYKKERMANTYLFLKESVVVAYFCISNDSLNDLGEVKGFTNKIWNRFHKRNSIPNPQRFRNYPR